ncbi:hypothetical protein B0T09DRAFT_336568 [Sordaria sp. MPI-SDFR-AT-0083]|nr:hypothetical protein B0T09DRAFT_336568 [Sordaria sp. MPI-SDFR-AT-0083]
MSTAFDFAVDDKEFDRALPCRDKLWIRGQKVETGQSVSEVVVEEVQRFFKLAERELWIIVAFGAHADDATLDGRHRLLAHETVSYSINHCTYCTHLIVVERLKDLLQPVDDNHGLPSPIRRKFWFVPKMRLLGISECSPMPISCWFGSFEEAFDQSSRSRISPGYLGFVNQHSIGRGSNPLRKMHRTIIYAKQSTQSPRTKLS